MKKYLYSGALALAAILTLSACAKPKLDAKLSVNDIVYMSGSDLKLKAAFDAHRDHIMSETLAKSLEYTDTALETYKLNGREAGIGVEKVEA